MHFFTIDIAKFKSGTSHMTVTQRGLYLDLLLLYYDKELPLPKDLNEVCRLIGARSAAQKEMVAVILIDKFEDTPEGWRHERADRELKRIYQKSVAASESAKARWDKERARKNKDLEKQEQAPRNANAQQSECGADATTLTTLTSLTLPTSSSASSDASFTLEASPQVLPPAKKASRKKATEGIDTRPTWDAYSLAYSNRYSVPPVRNASVNGKLSQFVQRVGSDEAPHIAAHYLRSSNAYYVREGHSVGALLKDAEKLRTEWATQRHTTNHEAMQADQHAAKSDLWTGLIEEARSKNEAQR